MTKDTHDCPLCKGTGKVTAKVANSRVSLRNREVFNATMRKVNARAAARKKLLATN